MKNAAVDPSRTLARLSFWVPAARLPEFEAAYALRLVPILKKHGLVESAERGRPTAEGIFSRLFAVEGPAAIAEKREALLVDPDWQRAVQDLDTALGILGKRVQRGFGRQAAGFYFSLYQMPAGSGTTVPAGPGRQVAAGRGRGRWRTFDATDGLPGGIIRAVLQDREGYLWIGSYGGGLSRYDGHSFQHFTPQEGLASRLVQSVIEDSEGNLWIGTGDQGLFRYDGQNFEHFTTQDGLVADEVLRVFQDREGHIWVGTFKGLSRYDGHRFQNFTAQDGLPNDQVHAIFQDQEGYLWFGTGEFEGERHKGGVSRYDGHSFQTFTTQEGLAVDAVWSILQNREGIFWFGTEEGLSRYDGRRFQTFTTEDGLGGNNVWPILQDQEGALWFGTKGGGVSRYDGRTFTTFTTQDGLGDNALEAIFQDREGSLWFGTWGGLSRYDSQLSATFTTEDGLADNEVLAILQDRAGVFWLGTSGGLSRYDGRTFTTFTVQDGLAANRVSGIFQDREGNLWFGHSEQTSGKGVTRYDGHCFTVFSAQDGLGSDRVGAIFQDQAGNLWFGVPGGVSRYDGEYFEYFAAADGLLAFVVGSIFQDQEGMLWFGSVWGLSRYDGRTFTSQEGLVAKWVRSICQAQGGDMWLGTQGEGVLRYNGQSVKSITTQDGLADDVVYSVLCDPRGRIWFGTPSGGVSLYDGQVFQSFTIHEGLGANNVGAILHDQAGNLWFGTTKGVTRYRPALPSSPPMYIDAVVADRRYEGETEISIPASVRLLAFEFHGISFKTRPEAMVYRYRLEGYVEDWRNTHSRRVEYQDLPVGEYTFEVRAVDRDLNYSAPARVHLKVIPDPRDQKIDELEQRVRERTRRLEEANEALSDANKELFRTLQEKEKAQELLVRSESMAAIGTLVAGVAHELNNPLGAAYSLTQTVQEMIEEDTPEQLQQEKAEIVGHLAFSRKELNRAKEIVAALLGLSRQNQDYTEAVEMNTVVQDALRVLYNQYKKYDLNLVEEYAEGLPVVQGNFAQLGQVCMNLIKNAIEALKGQEGQIVLKTYRDEEQVVFECADTGPGMPAEVRQRIFQPFFTTKAPGEGTGLGLYICHQTVEKHKGMIEVESEMGKGTVFRVKLPMRSI